GETYFFVRSPERFQVVVDAHRGKRIYIVTTFPRLLRLELAALANRIEQHWRVERTFPATVGDGAIAVWAPSR
ncbi:MAG: hypothetical protein H0W18_03065, partial [Acidobacteria bacterium]|nr:hypothetical protein [Acidobacteriota bacterium]